MLRDGHRLLFRAGQQIDVARYRPGSRLKSASALPSGTSLAAGGG